MSDRDQNTSLFDSENGDTSSDHGSDTSSDHGTLFAHARDPDEKAQEGAAPDDDAEEAGESAESGGSQEVDFDGFDIDSEVAIEADEWEKDESPLVWLFTKSARVKLAAFAVEQALEDNPAFINKSALAREAGVSRHSATRYLDDMVDLGIFRTRGYGYDRYCANPDSRVLKALVILERELYECV